MKTPNVAIWSQFRDDAGQYITDYFTRILSLQHPADNLRLYLTEGDSVDDTRQQLQSYAVRSPNIRLYHTDTGLPRLNHTPRPDRMKCLAQTARPAWDAIAKDGWADYLLMLESDILYYPDLLTRLLRRKPEEADIFAPMVWIQSDSGSLDTTRFYDIWAFRDLQGEMFRPYSPIWYGANLPREPFAVSSVGSVVLFDADVIRAGARLTEDEAVVGCCKWSRGVGYRIYADPLTYVMHPKVTPAQMLQNWRNVPVK